MVSEPIRGGVKVHYDTIEGKCCAQVVIQFNDRERSFFVTGENMGIVRKQVEIILITEMRRLGTEEVDRSQN